jgi:hypothetical protein
MTYKNKMDTNHEVKEEEEVFICLGYSILNVYTMKKKLRWTYVGVSFEMDMWLIYILPHDF